MEFKKLTKEQLAEARNCITEEEKKTFFKKQKIQLPDEALSNTVGGDIFPSELKCSKCGATFESYSDAVYHAFWNHFIGD